MYFRAYSETDPVSEIEPQTFTAQRAPSSAHQSHNSPLKTRSFQRRALALAISGALASGAATAQENETSFTLSPLVVDFRGDQLDSPKYSRKLMETPRTATVLNEDLLEEQNVTEMRDAMRNVSGISLQAGEGNPPGGGPAQDQRIQRTG